MMGPAMVHGIDQEDRYLAAGNKFEGVVGRKRIMAGKMRSLAVKSLNGPFLPLPLSGVRSGRTWSGICISFRPPRFTMRNGTWSVTVSGSGVLGSCGRSHLSGLHLAREAAEPVDAQPDIESVRSDVDPSDQ